MPNTVLTITIDPGGVSVAVNITQPSSLSFRAYTTRDGSTPVTFPVTISQRTVFYMDTAHRYNVSLVGPSGENADGSGGVAALDLRGGQNASLGYVSTAGKGTYSSYVVHGSTAGTSRPTSTGPVLWIGSVTPTNATAGDEWRDTTTDPYTVKIKGASTFTQVGGTSVAELAGTFQTVVVHGSTAGTARPTGAVSVLWIGTVQPTNIADHDVWLNPDAPGSTVTLDADGTLTVDGLTVEVATDAEVAAAVAAEAALRSAGDGILSTFDVGLLSTNAAWTNANRAMYWRVRQAATISKIALHLTGSSGNISVGVYADSGSGTPGARKATSGAVACPAAGYAEISLGGSVAVAAGDWFAMSADNTTVAAYCAFATGLNSALAAGRCGYADTAHPLASTAPTMTVGYQRSFLLRGVA